MHSLEQIVAANEDKTSPPEFTFFATSSLSLQTIGILGAALQDSGMLNMYRTFSTALDSGKTLHTIACSVETSKMANLFSIVEREWKLKREDAFNQRRRFRIMTPEAMNKLLQKLLED